MWLARANNDKVRVRVTVRVRVRVNVVIVIRVIRDWIGPNEPQSGKFVLRVKYCGPKGLAMSRAGHVKPTVLSWP